MFIFEKNPKNLQKPVKYSPTDGKDLVFSISLNELAKESAESRSLSPQFPSLSMASATFREDTYNSTYNPKCYMKKADEFMFFNNIYCKLFNIRVYFEILSDFGLAKNSANCCWQCSRYAVWPLILASKLRGACDLRVFLKFQSTIKQFIEA